MSTTWCPQVNSPAYVLVGQAHDKFMSLGTSTYNMVVGSLEGMDQIALNPYDFNVTFNFDNQLTPFVRPWASAPQLDWFGVLLMVFTVVGGTFGAYWLFLAGVMRIGSMRGTMLGTSEPIAATISAVLWAGAVFTPTDFVGFVMIIVMVFLVR